VTSSSDSSNQHPLPDTIDTSKPQSARFWNYLLGGKDNYLEAYSAILIGGVSPQLNRGLTRSTQLS